MTPLLSIYQSSVRFQRRLDTRFTHGNMSRWMVAFFCVTPRAMCEHKYLDLFVASNSWQQMQTCFLLRHWLIYSATPAGNQRKHNRYYTPQSFSMWMLHPGKGEGQMDIAKNKWYISWDQLWRQYQLGQFIALANKWNEACNAFTFDAWFCTHSLESLLGQGVHTTYLYNIHICKRTSYKKVTATSKDTYKERTRFSTTCAPYDAIKKCICYLAWELER